MGTAGAVVFDDLLGTLPQTIEEVKAARAVGEGVSLGRIAKEQAPAILTVFAAVPVAWSMVWVNGHYADRALEGAAGAGFGTTVTLACGLSILGASRTQLGAREAAREAGVFGELGRLPKNPEFQRDLADLVKRQGPLSDADFKTALKGIVKRHSGADGEQEVEDLFANNHGIDELIKNVRAPSFRQRWTEALSGAIAEQPAKLGQLAAVPVGAVGFAALNVLLKGGPMEHVAVQAVFSSMENILSLGTAVGGRTVANRRYARAVRGERRDLENAAKRTPERR